MAPEATDQVLRRSLREPIPAIFAAAEALNEAAEAHRRGDRIACRDLIIRANDATVREWAVPLLGAPSKNPHLTVRRVEGGPAILPKAARIPNRMPTRAERATLIERQGRCCAFCEIPLVRAEVRKALHADYPEAAVWGPAFEDCHAALLCMWLQYDHLLPHSRGGDNGLDNLVLTCAPCNYGRMSFTLAEVGLEDPRTRPWPHSSWDGLEVFLGDRRK